MGESMEWGPLDRAARIACGTLDGSASALLERTVRDAWESMVSDGVDPDDYADYATDYATNTAPTPTHEIWEAFGECSALRIALEETLEDGGGVDSMTALDDAMRYAFERTVALGLLAMRNAVAEVVA